MVTCEYCRSKFVECKSRPGTCSRCGAPAPKVTEVFEWSDYCRVPIYATASGMMLGDPGLIFPSGIALADGPTFFERHKNNRWVKEDE